MCPRSAASRLDRGSSKRKTLGPWRVPSRRAVAVHRELSWESLQEILKLEESATRSTAAVMAAASAFRISSGNSFPHSHAGRAHRTDHGDVAILRRHIVHPLATNLQGAASDGLQARNASKQGGLAAARGAHKHQVPPSSMDRSIPVRTWVSP